MFKRLGIIAIYLVVSACAEKALDPNDPAGSFATAKEPYDSGNHEIALSKLGEFKSRFPYSKYAVEAELLIANSYFELQNYPEAAVSYEQFVKLHPKHPEVDFALFRIGESYWADAPEEIDREQDYTRKAVEEWQRLVQRLPDSEYSAQARKLINEGKRRIAENIAFIGRFYCKQDVYHACAYRFIQLADEYGEFTDLRVEALETAIEALEKVAAEKEKKPDADTNIYFRSMTASEIRAKKDNLANALTRFKAEQTR